MDEAREIASLPGDRLQEGITAIHDSGQRPVVARELLEQPADGVRARRQPAEQRVEVRMAAGERGARLVDQHREPDAGVAVEDVEDVLQVDGGLDPRARDRRAGGQRPRAVAGVDLDELGSEQVRRAHLRTDVATHGPALNPAPAVVSERVHRARSWMRDAPSIQSSTASAQTW